MRRTLTRVCVTAAAAGASLALLPSSPASATSAAALTDCPALSLCGWSLSNFNGTMTTFGAGAGCLNSPIPLRSVANTYPGGGAGIPVALLVYSGTGCTGTYLGTVHRGQSLPFLPGVGVSVRSVF